MTGTSPLADEELAAMPAKTKKDPATVELYQRLPFIEAYAAHTDKRVAENGYKAAIGADEHNWDSHGELQLNFLRSRGLRAEDTLLEIGCGTGRLARKAAMYLNDSNYHGLDISRGAIEAALSLALAEGWDVKHPTFHLGDLPKPCGAFDFIWSFSVMIHVPCVVMEAVLKRAARVMHRRSRFYWSFVPEKETYRSGVKQFRKTLADHRNAAAAAGLTFQPVPQWIEAAGYEPGRWSGNQQLAVSMLAGVDSAP